MTTLPSPVQSITSNPYSIFSSALMSLPLMRSQSVARLAWLLNFSKKMTPFASARTWESTPVHLSFSSHWLRTTWSSTTTQMFPNCLFPINLPLHYINLGIMAMHHLLRKLHSGQVAVLALWSKQHDASWWHSSHFMTVQCAGQPRMRSGRLLIRSKVYPVRLGVLALQW